MRIHLSRWFFLGVCLMPGVALAAAPDLAPFIQALRNVEPEGKGHREATYAWSQLTDRATAGDLPVILAGMDDAGPLAANWLRAAVDAVAESQFQKTGKLPTDKLEKFLTQKEHNPRARRLAFEWLARVDASAPDRLIPGMLNDPSLELRRDAVARLVAAAEKSLAADNQDEALATYRKSLVAARDLDQVQTITEALEKLGHPVDLAHHYGFIEDWKLVGPFDNRGGKGFAASYPPEATVDPSASYETVDGPRGWIAHRTLDKHGNVDLNKALGKHMGVVAYAVAEFTSDRRRPIELRVGTPNALKIWLNGKQLATAEVYHSNSAMDQYVGRGELLSGRNVILLKVCQNEMTVEWAQDWKFQLRACDGLGQAVLSTDRPPARSAAELTAVNKDASDTSKKE